MMKTIVGTQTRTEDGKTDGIRIARTGAFGLSHLLGNVVKELIESAADVLNIQGGGTSILPEHLKEGQPKFIDALNLLIGDEAAKEGISTVYSQLKANVVPSRARSVPRDSTDEYQPKIKSKKFPPKRSASYQGPRRGQAGTGSAGRSSARKVFDEEADDKEPTEEDEVETEEIPLEAKPTTRGEVFDRPFRSRSQLSKINSQIKKARESRNKKPIKSFPSDQSAAIAKRTPIARNRGRNIMTRSRSRSARGSPSWGQGMAKRGKGKSSFRSASLRSELRSDRGGIGSSSSAYGSLSSGISAEPRSIRDRLHLDESPLRGRSRKRSFATRSDRSEIGSSSSPYGSRTSGISVEPRSMVERPNLDESAFRNRSRKRSVATRSDRGEKGQRKSASEVPNRRPPVGPIGNQRRTFQRPISISLGEEGSATMAGSSPSVVNVEDDD